MSLRFPYRPYRVGQPPVSMGKRTARVKPVIPISLTGPAGLFAYDALVDTGSDEIVFPQKSAAKIGVDLSIAPVGQGGGANQSPIPVRYAEVTLRLSDGHENREWRAWVGFTPSPMRWGLLGFAGFLEYFTAVFDGVAEAVELTVNPLYPGT